MANGRSTNITTLDLPRAKLVGLGAERARQKSESFFASELARARS
jgi:hypothetical protein